MEAAYQRRIKALYIIGENPLLSEPDTQHVKDALEELEFLVVQDIFFTETARLADVVSRQPLLRRTGPSPTLSGVFSVPARQ